MISVVAIVAAVGVGIAGWDEGMREPLPEARVVSPKEQK